MDYQANGLGLGVQPGLENGFEKNLGFVVVVFKPQKSKI